MQDRAREVEILAEARPQTRGADAFGADDGIALENEGFHARPCGFAGRGAAGRPAPDDQKVDLLHDGGTLRAPSAFSAFGVGAKDRVHARRNAQKSFLIILSNTKRPPMPTLFEIRRRSRALHR
ncbi:MAG: hypothetical protein NVS2B8_05270 [Vulcanimicrobiaceae bacterium]